MTAGVAMSRENTNPHGSKMNFPERIRLRGKVRRQNALKKSDWQEDFY